jgi:hypothetical protein
LPSDYYSPYDLESTPGTYEESSSHDNAGDLPEETDSYYSAATPSYQQDSSEYDANKVTRYLQESPTYYTTAPYSSTGYYTTAAPSYYTTKYDSSVFQSPHYEEEHPNYYAPAYTTGKPTYYTTTPSFRYYVAPVPNYYSQPTTRYYYENPPYPSSKPASSNGYQPRQSFLTYSSYPSYQMNYQMAPTYYRYVY